MRRINVVTIPLSRLDDIALALKTGYRYESRDGNKVTLSKIVNSNRRLAEAGGGTKEKHIK